MKAFWETAPCSLVEVVCNSITTVYLNVTTLHNFAENCHLHTRHCENLKSHVVPFSFAEETTLLVTAVAVTLPRRTSFSKQCDFLNRNKIMYLTFYAT